MTNFVLKSQSVAQKPRILCFVEYYLPGFRSGGPVRTIANFVDHLGDEYDIFIVTRDRDVLDTASYFGMEIDAWNTVGKARVYYGSRHSFTLAGVAQLLCNTPHDLLYLNSFFSFSFTGLPLLARRIGLAIRTPCVIAPRGEFSSGALSLKARKKYLYIAAAKAIGLYCNLHWQASSKFEEEDICREFGIQAKKITIAPNLPPRIESKTPSNCQYREPGPLRLVFLSRICPKKNLTYLLETLCDIPFSIYLGIYGPIEDHRYWSKCMAIIQELPLNVSVYYAGEVIPSDVRPIFASHDLFVLPTMGENFGHVILESLSAGTPALISDQTPWRGDRDGGLEELPLDDMVAWQARLGTWAGFNETTLLARREAAMRVAQNFLGDPSLIQSTKILFHQALQLSDGSLACVE